MYPSPDPRRVNPARAVQKRRIAERLDIEAAHFRVAAASDDVPRSLQVRRLNGALRREARAQTLRAEAAALDAEWAAYRGQKRPAA